MEFIGLGQSQKCFFSCNYGRLLINECRGRKKHRIFLWLNKTFPQFSKKYRNLFIPYLIVLSVNFFQLRIVKFCKPLTPIKFVMEYFFGGLKCSKYLEHGLYRNHKFRMPLCFKIVCLQGHIEGICFQWKLKGKFFSCRNPSTWKGRGVFRNKGNYAQILLWNYLRNPFLPRKFDFLSNFAELIINFPNLFLSLPFFPIPRMLWMYSISTNSGHVTIWESCMAICPFP